MHCPCHAMVVSQTMSLEKALDEHKWYESEKAGHDIGCQEAQMNFIETIITGWAQQFRDEFCKDCPKRVIKDKRI